MDNFIRNPNAEIIASATGARGDDLLLIEEIMRTELFHSTLDWQTRPQLEKAAQEAAALLEADRVLYTLGLKVRRLTFEEIRLADSHHTPASQRKLRVVREQLEEACKSLNLLLT